MYANPDQLLYNALARAFAPRKALTVSQWADNERRLSKKGSAEPGPWRTSRNPPLAEPMDCLSARSTVRDIVLMWPIQYGKTEVAANCLGYTMDHNPGPVMVCLPGEVSMHKWINQKLNPMIEETPAVAETLTSLSSRDASNTRTFKDFRGGQLYFEHAGSPSRLKSTSVRTLIVDELDEFASNLHGGDDPVDMLLGRTSAFPATYKRLFISTPQIKGISRTEQLYEKSDQRRFYVPCPHCQHEQSLEWAGLHWDPDGSNVHYVCTDCGVLIEEHHKTAMIAAGRWIAQKPGAKIRGYHINCLYYPIGLGPRWADLVEMWRDAQNDPARLKTFVNDRLAEAWDDPSMRKLRLNALVDRSDDYPLRIAPIGVAVITAGVDTQDDRLAVQIVGWGKNKSFWVLDYVELPGDPNEDHVWIALTDLINSGIPRSNSGEIMPISATAIDFGGHRTLAVKQFVRKRLIRRPMAIHGAKNNNAPILGKPKADEFRQNGRTIKYGLHIYSVGTVSAKSILFGIMNTDADLDPEIRMSHFSNRLSHDYFKMLSSEQYDHKKNRYINPKGNRNESIDTLVYAFAAANHPEIRIGSCTNSKLELMEKGSQRPETEPVPVTSAAKPTNHTQSLIAARQAARRNR